MRIEISTAGPSDIRTVENFAVSADADEAARRFLAAVGLTLRTASPEALDRAASRLRACIEVNGAAPQRSA